ncbi:MAG TPA: hypothetical protein VGT99_00585 [Gammaproteobacteria bacterium]|nr:hypothetical protein [Gammaproteobacteria bacterium]
MINRRVAALLVLIAPLAACVTGSDSTTPSPNPNAAFTARFTPLAGIMPFPNDLYFNGSTTGTLNIPGSATVAQNGPLLQLNHLDGYGTESDISIYFTQPVDATTLTPNNVLVFKVASSATTKAVDPTKGATLLNPTTDYSIGLSPGIDSGGEIVTIKPLHPLAASTVVGTTATPATYLVVVTTGVKSSTGSAVAASSDYATIVAADGPAIAALDVTKINLAATDPLLPVAQFTFPQLLVAAGAKIPLANVAVTFSFSTAYLGLSLAELSAGATATTQPTGAHATGIVDTGETVCAVLVASGQLPNTAACAAVPGSTATEVFAGTVALPYYLTVPATGSKAAVTDFWQNAAGGDTAISTNPASLLPKATVAQNIIPILVALPKTGGPCTNGPSWPTVIFQHGITRNREDMLGIASTLVMGGAPSFCTAVVAIDLPLHGVTNTADPFYQNQVFATAAPNLVTGERTFNMDATGAAGATGSNIDGSGQLFINLNSTITSRDNLREGAADLINLVATLPTLSAVTPSPLSVNTFNGAAVFFVGHSLGGIVGTDFLGADTAGHALGGPLRIAGAVLASPGGHIAELLRNSATFGSIIDTQLAANGLVKGSQSYYDFYSEAQAVVEDGDPANYAALASGGHLTHMLEVVGGLDATSLPDQVVPNTATDVLLAQMGIGATVSTAGPHAIALGAPTLAQFTSGSHGSVLSPGGAAAADVVAYTKVTTEMQTEIIKLFGSIAAATPATVVTDPTYLSPTLVK